MTKSELVEQLTIDNDVLNKREAELIINSIFDSIGQALVEGDRVEIRGFGSFTVRERDAREARNPKAVILCESRLRRPHSLKPAKSYVSGSTCPANFAFISVY